MSEWAGESPPHADGSAAEDDGILRAISDMSLDDLDGMESVGGSDGEVGEDSEGPDAVSEDGADSQSDHDMGGKVEEDESVPENSSDVRIPDTLDMFADVDPVSCMVGTKEGHVCVWTRTSLYQVIKTVRKTIYGKVKLAAVCRMRGDGLFYPTREIVVLKVNDKERIAKAVRSARTAGIPLREDPVTEIRMMQFTNVPGCQSVSKLIDTVHDKAILAPILPFINGGDIMDAMQTRGGFSEPQAQLLCKDLLQGLVYLHYVKGLAHRDISFENVMVQKTPEGPRLVIIDLGGAAVLPCDKATKHFRKLPAGQVGKASCMAPEVFHRRAYYGHLADMWSAGVVLFGILTGFVLLEFPDAKLDKRRYPYVVNGGLRTLMKSYGVTAKLSSACIEVMMSMLQEDPMKRPTALDLLNCEWLGGDGNRVIGPTSLATYMQLETALHGSLGGSLRQAESSGAEGGVDED